MPCHILFIPFRYRKKHFPRTHFHKQCTCDTSSETDSVSKHSQLYPNINIRNEGQCNHDLCLQLEDTLSEHSGEHAHVEGTTGKTKPLKSILKEANR